MSGRKPMSSIRSASSSTTKRTSPSISDAAADQVQHAAGRADDDLGPAAELLDLLADRLAAVDGHDAHVAPGGQLDALVADLHGQFARGHEDQRLRCRAVAIAARGVRGSGWRRRPSCRCRSGPGPSGRRPASAGGISPAWMGVGSRYSASSKRGEHDWRKPHAGEAGRGGLRLGRVSCGVLRTLSWRVGLRSGK